MAGILLSQDLMLVPRKAEPLWSHRWCIGLRDGAATEAEAEGTRGCIRWPEAWLGAHYHQQPYWAGWDVRGPGVDILSWAVQTFSGEPQECCLL